MSILQAEDLLIEKTSGLVGDYVKEVDSLAGEFDVQTMKRISRKLPGVYWSFLGGPANSLDPDANLNSRWLMYVVTQHASGQAARRRGDSREVGCYELLALLLPALHGFTLPGIGSLSLSRVDNLFNGTFEKQGVSLYAATFNLPISFDAALPAGLDHFITFHADYDVEPHTPSEHERWSQEDHTDPAPDAQGEDTMEQ